MHIQSVIQTINLQNRDNDRDQASKIKIEISEPWSENLNVSWLRNAVTIGRVFALHARNAAY